MRTRSTLAAAMVGLLAAGCGHSTSQRAAVAAYLKKVNKVESQLVAPLTTVTTTGNEFAREQKAGGTLTNLLTASHEQALLKAWSRIRAVRARLAAIVTPPRATYLRTLLLEVIDGQARLTDQLAKLVVFLPRYDDALRPLGPATRRLEAALSLRTAFGPAGVAALYARKAAALHHFQGDVGAVLRELHGLDPPAFSKPGFVAQLLALRGMRTSAGRLAAALANGPQGNVQQILAEFDRAATSPQTVTAQKAQIAAIRAYDAQVTRLANLSNAAELERLRLSTTLT